jgi:hypothetical protein
MDFDSTKSQNQGMIIGQVAKEETWTKNQKRKKWRSGQDEGFGQRYRVRIVGKHDKKEIPDEELELCKVIMPVTAGTGHANASQTANIKEGSWVQLQVADSEESTEYFIIGLLPNDSQVKKLPAANPQNGFSNKTGINGENPYRADDGRPSFGLTSSNEPTESNSGSDVLETYKGDDDQEKDGKKKTNLPVRRKSGGEEILAIQLFMQDMIQQLEEARKFAKGIASQIENASSISDFEEEICKKATDFISGMIKNLLEEIRKMTLDLIQQDVKQEYGKVWEEDQIELMGIQEKIWELISCLFNKIIDSLKPIVEGVICPLFKGGASGNGKAVNFPECASIDVGANIIKEITEPLLSGIESVTAPLYALLGKAPTISIDILGYIESLTGFFSCEGKPELEGLMAWSLWDGAGSIQSSQDITKIFGEAGGPQGSGGGCGGNKETLAPQRCGPPTVSFSSGGARANAIVSSTGDILAVDVIHSGSSTPNFPHPMISDPCGTGVGVHAIPVTTPNNQVSSVTILFPGNGYLPAPNGSMGGDNRTFSKPNQTIIRRYDDSWELPFDPGEEIPLVVGDEVILPDFASVDFPISIGKRKIIEEPVVIIAPEPDIPEIPQRGNADTYGVILSICNPVIVRSGFGYSPDDTIEIEPNNGTKLKPVFNKSGSLIRIEVIDPGFGYDFWPMIYVKSNTGFNAKIVPNFCVNKVEDLVDEIPEGTPIISVIDCVGKLIPEN